MPKPSGFREVLNRSGYAQAFAASIDAIQASGSIASLPRPIGDLSGNYAVLLTDNGLTSPQSDIAFENVDGTIFVATANGKIALVKKGLTAVSGPTFDQVVASNGNPAAGGYILSLIGMNWTLPGGLEYQPKTDTVDLEGAGESSKISPLTWVVGAAALYFLTQ
jgi:hypothetical protein